MAILLQVFRVDNHAVVGHSALIKHLRKQYIELSEFRAHLGEVNSPLSHILSGADHLGVVELVESADKSRTSNENLALRACIAGESLAHKVDNSVLGKCTVGISERLSGLSPDASREHHGLFLVGVPQLVFHSKEEVLLHAEAHIIDCSLLLVGHRPIHFLVGDFLERTLLNLHLENLAVVLSLLRQSLKLRRLHIKLGSCTPHSDESFSGIKLRHDSLSGSVRLAIHSHHHKLHIVLTYHIEHKSAVLVGFTGIGIAGHALHKQRVAHVDTVIVVGLEPSSHIACKIRRTRHKRHRGGLGIYIVIIHNHAPGALGSGTARQLVNRRCHRADFHNLAVNLIHK